MMIMNIERSTQIQHVYHVATPASSQSDAHLLHFDLLDPEA